MRYQGGFMNCTIYFIWKFCGNVSQNVIPSNCKND